MTARSTIRRAALTAVCALLAAALPAAQEPSPYTGLEEREVKALSSQQIDGYLAGEGMSLALAAELNGYPGPKHVLELAAELGLSAEQVSRSQAIFDAMHAAAVELGRRIVEGEKALDRLFSEGEISDETLAELTAELGRDQGRLRAVHLRAHLEQAEVLDEVQRRHYVELRGYHRPDESGGHSGHAGHAGH